MKCKTISWKGEFFTLFIFTAIFILLSNARSVKPNPFIPGMVMDVTIIIPIIAGILFGCRTGLLVGLVAPLVNAFTPAGGMPYFVMILPYVFLGFMAGFLQDTIPSPIISGLAFVGNVLIVLLFAAFGMLAISYFSQKLFWLGILYESFLDMVAIIVISNIYRLGFEGRTR